MRLLASAFAAFAVALIVAVLSFAPPALAASEVAADPTILDQIKEALGGLVLLVITVVAAFVAKALPGLLDAARLWLIERATSERVQRLDDAIDLGLDAGLSPEGVAAMVAGKLPQTLKRSNKSVDDLTGEAIERRRARAGSGAARPAAK